MPPDPRSRGSSQPKMHASNSKASTHHFSTDTTLACAASGKSGGFLALDWCDGTPLEALARRSFALHAELTEQIGGEWGYRPLTTYGGLVSAHTRHGDRAHETRW